MSEKEKLGNGGYGPEDYDTADGKYVADGKVNTNGELSEADKEVIQNENSNFSFDQDSMSGGDDDLDAYLDSLELEAGEDDLDAFLDSVNQQEELPPEKDSFVSKTLLYRIEQAGKKYQLMKETMNIEDYVDVESVTDPEDMIETLVNKYHLNRKKLEQLDGEHLENVFKSLYLVAYKQHLRYQKNTQIEEWDLAAKIKNAYLNFDVKEEQALIGELVPRNDVYSQVAKNTAVWITNDTATGSETAKLVKKYFDYSYSLMTAAERKALIGYTGSYSWINEPLYGATYQGTKSFANASNFAETVKNMTNGINKSDLPFNIWVQRGSSSDAPYFPVGYNGKKISLLDMDDNEMDKLVGTSFKAGNFFSCGGSKDSGFSDKSLIFNIYCPKGTKMAYMNFTGQFSNSHENEFILQRGYSYKIAKVERKGSKYYMDLEVDLASLNDLDNSTETLINKWYGK